MIFVNIDIVHFYQLPKIASKYKNRQPAVSSLYFFTTFGSNKKRKKTLLSLDQIENFDITSLQLKESLNPFHISASNFSGIEANVKSIVLLSYYLNKQELILSNISNRLISTHKHNLSSFVQNDNSTFITNLLQKRRSKGSFKYITEDYYNSTVNLR